MLWPLGGLVHDPQWVPVSILWTGTGGRLCYICVVPHLEASWLLPLGLFYVCQSHGRRSILPGLDEWVASGLATVSIGLVLLQFGAWICGLGLIHCGSVQMWFLCRKWLVFAVVVRGQQDFFHLVWLPMGLTIIAVQEGTSSLFPSCRFLHRFVPVIALPLWCFGPLPWDVLRTLLSPLFIWKQFVWNVPLLGGQWLC